MRVMPWEGSGRYSPGPGMVKLLEKWFYQELRPLMAICSLNPPGNLAIVSKTPGYLVERRSDSLDGHSRSDTHNSEIRPSGGSFYRQPRAPEGSHRTRCEVGSGSILADRGAGTSGDCAGLILSFLSPTEGAAPPDP